MARKSSNKSVIPTPKGFPIAKNISDLLSKPVYIRKWEVVPGKDRDYHRIHCIDAYSGHIYLIGTNAATIVEQLAYIPTEPDEPVLVEFVQFGRMYAMQPLEELPEQEVDYGGSAEFTGEENPSETLPDMQ